MKTCPDCGGELAICVATNKNTKEKFEMTFCRNIYCDYTKTIKGEDKNECAKHLVPEVC